MQGKVVEAKSSGALTGHGELAIQLTSVALGGKKAWRRIAVAVHAAAADPGGIAAERDATLERATFARQDWMAASQQVIAMA